MDEDEVVRPPRDPHRTWAEFFSDNSLLANQQVTAVPVTPPKTDVIRHALGRAIERYSAHQVAAICEGLGLAPAAEGEDPFSGKYRYAMRRLDRLGHEEVVRVARAFVKERDAAELEAVLGALDARALGPDGHMRNLIFASNGPKPQIVLDDAVDNQIRITGNIESCLVYDRAPGADGLRWSDLLNWWATTRGIEDEAIARMSLWGRLRESMDSDPERTMFDLYLKSFQSPAVPALIPQVYLHYDPYTRSSGQHSGLVRERMDFLLLLPGHRRVVVEIDGKHHYATDEGRADPVAYARMVSEDRRLRLRGYEVYRFGGQEFVGPVGDVADRLRSFFVDLLGEHAGSG